MQCFGGKDRTLSQKDEDWSSSAGSPGFPFIALNIWRCIKMRKHSAQLVKIRIRIRITAIQSSYLRLQRMQKRGLWPRCVNVDEVDGGPGNVAGDGHAGGDGAAHQHLLGVLLLLLHQDHLLLLREEAPPIWYQLRVDPVLYLNSLI